MKLLLKYLMCSDTGTSTKKQLKNNRFSQKVDISFGYLATLLFLLLLVPSKALADTFTVTNTNDSGIGSLRDAVAQAEANPGADTIVFDGSLAGQTITLTSKDGNIQTVNGSCSDFSGNYIPSGALQVTQSLTVDGSSAPGITISGNWNGITKSTQGNRIFYIPSTANGGTSAITLNLNDLTIDKGNAGQLNGGGDPNNPCSNGGAIYMDSAGGALNFTRVNVNGSHSNDGGGLKIERGDLNVSNSTFSENRARDDGGAIDVDGGGTATLVNSTIADNIAGIGQAGTNPGPKGGAVRLDGTMNLTYVTVAYNRSGGDGAFIENKGTLNIRNSLMVDNDSTVEGNNKHCKGTVNDLGNNWESISNVGDTPSCGFNNGNNKDIEANIKLSPTLANNGGLTRTLSLDPSSSVNAVISTSSVHPTTNNKDCGGVAGVADQRYFFRAVGAGCEPGAYELAQAGQTRTISGQIYEDKNRNGTFDSGTDTPLADGILVKLYKDSDPNTVVAETLTTGGDGSYSFPGVPDGDYKVEVDETDTDIPGNLIITNNPQDITVNGNDTTGVDFGFTQPTANIADVLLVKRITAINGNRTQNPNDNTPLNAFVDDTTSTRQDDDNSPNWLDNYLIGAINAGKVKPGDEIEYTVYFLNAGGSNGENLKICDRIASNQDFKLNAYGTGNDFEFQLGTNTLINLTSANDTNDRAQLISAGAAVDTKCNLKGTNDNGTIEINITGTGNTTQSDLTNIPGSTGKGTPNNSYGFFRFTTTVKQ
ncbi:MAG: SdrD B-like domain-containing protein [Cyanobacteria bacterium J06629_18]